MEEFKAKLAEGCARRKVGQTGLNDASSRSHGVLMVTVTCNSDGTQTTGKLNIIDLAGACGLFHPPHIQSFALITLACIESPHAVLE